jgi:ribonuclease BN (tRNA processing enzyme)
MNAVMLPSGHGREGNSQFLTSFVLNDAVAIDAGSLGFQEDLNFQRGIRHVFLTHSHVDHIASLPIFLESAYMLNVPPPRIFSLPETREAIHRHIFNDLLYPDFIRLSAEGYHILEWQGLAPGQAVSVAGLRLTPIPVCHPIPTVGYLVEDDHSTIAFVTDTGPSSDIWQECAKRANLRAVFLECAFPNSLHWLADRAGHMCTELIPAELAKFAGDVPVYMIHIKPHHRPEIIDELRHLHALNLKICEPGKIYQF